MSSLWWIALGVVAAATGPLYLAQRQVAQELDGLRRSVIRLHEVRPALGELRSSVARTARNLQDLGPR